MLTEFVDNFGRISLKVSVSNLDGSTNNVFISSKYDVLKEANDFAKLHSSKFKDINILYGIGLGYHILEIVKLLDTHQKLYVFDLREDIYEYANSKGLYDDIINNNQVEICVSNDYIYLSKKMNEIINDNVYFFSHYPSIKVISFENDEFKFILEKLQITRTNNLKLNIKNQMLENESKNVKLHDNNASLFFDKFIEVPGIIVSAGPSLGKSLEGLKEIGDNAIIFAVGRSLSSLLENGISPHFFCIIDSDDLTYQQIKGYENKNIPFIYLNTTSNKTVSSYKGPRFITYNSSEETDYIDTGGSVATAVFDLLIKFGCDPIIFIGQDLAYTNNNTHYKGAKYSNISIEKKELKNMRKVKDVYGGYLNTDLGLLSFKKWFEKKITQHDIKFINCSFGAEIIGAKHMEIQEAEKIYIKKELNISTKINMIVESLNSKGI